MSEAGGLPQGDTDPARPGGYTDPSGQDPEAKARGLCLRMLTHNPRTRAQLERALLRRGFEEDVVASVLGTFSDAGLIDDRLFAEAWVSSRHHGRRLSRKALARELRTRGVQEETVREAVDELTDEEEEQAARDLARRSLAGSRGKNDQTRVRRALNVLARRGHSAGLSYRVVREELEAEGVDVELHDPDL